MIDWLRSLFFGSGKAAVAPATQEAVHAPAASAARAMRPPRFAADDVSALQRYQIDFMFSSWLFETEQQTEIFTNRNEDAVLAALDEVVNSKDSGAHMVHRMPGVIPHLLQSLRNPEFDGVELARRISHDVVLVAEVLRLANSVAFRPGKPIEGIDHAILVLGQNGLRQLISGVAFRPIINLHSGAFTYNLAPRLWAQSEQCAFACNLLAQNSPADPLDAFLAGLVQNVGLTVSLRIIDRISDGRQPIGSPTFCNELAAKARILTGNIGREWRFPEAVTTAIREQESDEKLARLSAIGKILWMGDYLSKIDILVRRGRLKQDDPTVVEGLSDNEIDCLEKLAAVDEKDWLSASAAQRSR
ncbi:MAG TPA: HDOD domain-containing protein [Noviherbaspirillum sp.]|uniref:HDOD domain-containing protein n=1 Tax=Noviherbaspirillum sp. TaxID=1926288 RepID=UPI002B48B870|nr:HDOD domain-containing protein [Noviherbaspirillum sp.]HJV86227.1 HDOD domain-containing protein [Noviherbaspirillum sp.]